jgi:biopolymer transport protein ExbD
MKMGSSKARKVSDEIPTSSMADIAFLLIIYFMVTSTFAATRGLDFSFPPEEEQTTTIEPEEAVLIEIQPGGETVVDGKPMQMTEISIANYLRPKLQNNPQKPVIIRPDPSAPYGSMVGVLDDLRLAEQRLQKEIGIKNINISLPTQREIDLFWY